MKREIEEFIRDYCRYKCPAKDGKIIKNVDFEIDCVCEECNEDITVIGADDVTIELCEYCQIKEVIRQLEIENLI